MKIRSSLFAISPRTTLCMITLFTLIGFLGSCQEKPTIKGAIWLTNGRIIDGTGSAAFAADVLINGDTIAWVGNAAHVQIQADTVIDVNGLIVTPGFIDIHAHGDPLETPDFDNFLYMGVTSIALGMDGSGTSVSALPDWFESIRMRNIGVNILPFIGHGTIRNNSGKDAGRGSDKERLKRMENLIDAGLSLGCWGVSMGLEYLPGYYADAVELEHIAKVVGKHNALITSHIRNEDNEKVEDSIDEMTRLSEWCKVNISHLKVVYGKGVERATDLLSALHKRRKYEVTADLYPYTASYTGIGIVFPEWAKRPKTYGHIKKSRGKELADHLRARVLQRNGPEATLFGNGPYKGKTLAQVASEYDMPFELVLRDIIGPYGSSAAYFVMDPELQQALALDSLVCFASDGSPTMFHPRGYGTNAKIIESYVMADSLMHIEKAIYKMTGLPAHITGLEDRGTIAVGNYADLVIFDPAKVHAKATFDSPHQLAEGFSWVIVNGQISLAKGQRKANHGRLLLRR